MLNYTFSLFGNKGGGGCVYGFSMFVSTDVFERQKGSGRAASNACLEIVCMRMYL